MNKIQNQAFIDANNLYMGAKTQNIKLHYGKLRQYLRNKFHVKQAFLFIGYTPHNTDLYNMLQKFGFTLIFKPTVPFTDEKGHQTMKGNVDAELVLYSAAIEYRHYDKAVVITGDGDFACLFKFLKQRHKLAKIITPTKRYSKLLKPFYDNILPLKIIKKQIEE